MSDLSRISMVASTNLSASSIRYKTNAREGFETYLDTIHRIVGVSSISQLFGHLTNDAISGTVLQVVKINAASSSHIFVTESMGLPTLKNRSVESEINASCANRLPLDDP